MVIKHTRKNPVLPKSNSAINTIANIEARNIVKHVMANTAFIINFYSDSLLIFLATFGKLFSR